MSERIETHVLQGDSPGAQRKLVCHRFGQPEARPKIYLQAGLHANEMPGILILQHLLPLLRLADVEGRIAGEILVVPAANPIGLGQWAFQHPLGRQEADSLHNFNRGFPELAGMVGDRLESLLTADPLANRDLIRQEFRAALAEARATARTDMIEMQLRLLEWSCDADHVLDLHCDHHAVLHLYASPAQPQVTTLLCRAIGAELALIQDVSGGHAFDEAHTAPWLLLKNRFGGRFPIPEPCFSATLEYRGQLDVSDALAARDAAHLMTFLAATGAVRDHDGKPQFPDARHLPLGGAGEAFAPQGGVIAWHRREGDEVAYGEAIARVTDPVTGISRDVLAPNAGLLFRRELWPSCQRGQSLAHVAGESILRSGDLLSD